MTAAGFDIKPGEHPIVPIMLYDAKLAAGCCRRLVGRGHLRDRLLVPCRPER